MFVEGLMHPHITIADTSKRKMQDVFEEQWRVRLEYNRSTARRWGMHIYTHVFSKGWAYLNSRHRELHLISNIEAFRHGGGSQGENPWNVDWFVFCKSEKLVGWGHNTGSGKAKERPLLVDLIWLW